MIKDAYPLKAQFDTEEEVNIFVQIDNPEKKQNLTIICSVRNLAKEVYHVEKTVPQEVGELSIPLKIKPCDGVFKGYHVELALYEGNIKVSEYFTAFDRAASWKCAPRYGFLADFSSTDLDEEDIKSLNRYHINIIQFYDWMYRHHSLVPPSESFVNPFGKKMSRKSVEQKIAYAHQYGMKAFAYAAIYAAQKDFWEEHKDYGLYRNDGQQINLGEVLYIMDISKENGWHNYILQQFLNTIEFGFDGLHMDQYGTPKEAISINGLPKVRYLRDDFKHFINDTRDFFMQNNRDAALIFNAVNNWPIESVASTAQDVTYIEVWSPNDTYEGLYKLITDAKKYSPHKHVILAAYLSPFMDGNHTKIEYAYNSALLTMAVIFLSGGTHLLLGEKNGILMENYYVNYATVKDNAFISKLRNYYDFIVCYEELLFDTDIVDNTVTYTGGINEEYKFSSKLFGNADAVRFSIKAESNTVWTVIKEKTGVKVIHLLNLSGIESTVWNEEKPVLSPEIRDIEITALVVEEITGIFISSPDLNNCLPEKLEYEYVAHPLGKAVRFTVPSLKVWDVVWVETQI